jgi:hypothetical protein
MLTRLENLCGTFDVALQEDMLALA